MGGGVKGGGGGGLNIFSFLRFLMVFDDCRRFFCDRLKCVQCLETGGSFESSVVFHNFNFKT